MRRIILALLVLAGLSPGLLWRASPPPSPVPTDGPVEVTPLALPDEACDPRRRPCAEAAWVLSGPQLSFGGYSALLTDGLRFTAFSDGGMALDFLMPDIQTGPAAPSMRRFDPFDHPDKRFNDVESAELARDGTLWFAYEGTGDLLRADPNTGEVRLFAVPQILEWPQNAGPEALTILADGRLLVFSEKTRRGLSEGLVLSPRNPAQEVTEFRFGPPDGFRPTGATTLPDGRVLILVRALQFLPPGFRGQLVLADPTQIRAGGILEGETVLRLEPELPTDNYEGVAVTQLDDGSLRIWLISDDNGLKLQRTILMALRWFPPEQD